MIGHRTGHFTRDGGNFGYAGISLPSTATALIVYQHTHNQQWAIVSNQ
jgi:hypothetical protein